MRTITDVRVSQVTPTIDANAYAAKDTIGGLLTFPGAFSPTCRSGKVAAVAIADKADNAVAYDLVFFRSLPTGTFTNNAAFDPTDADLALISPVVRVLSTDHFSFNDNGVSSVGNLRSYVRSDSTDLYAALVARDSVTYASTSDITITLLIEQDG